jgi:hypothetical protein
MLQQLKHQLAPMEASPRPLLLHHPHLTWSKACSQPQSAVRGRALLCGTAATRGPRNEPAACCLHHCVQATRSLPHVAHINGPTTPQNHQVHSPSSRQQHMLLDTLRCYSRLVLHSDYLLPPVLPTTITIIAGHQPSLITKHHRGPARHSLLLLQQHPCIRCCASRAAPHTSRPRAHTPGFNMCTPVRFYQRLSSP